jgi:hypothetical protein
MQRFRIFAKRDFSSLDHAVLGNINLGALMPLKADDEQIFKHRIITAPMGGLNLVTGFVIHSRISWQALQDPHVKKKDECLCYRSRLPAAQVAHLQNQLKACAIATMDAILLGSSFRSHHLLAASHVARKYTRHTPMVSEHVARPTGPSHVP